VKDWNVFLSRQGGGVRLPAALVARRIALVLLAAAMTACSSKPVLRRVARDGDAAVDAAADRSGLAPAPLGSPDAGELPPPRTEELDCAGAARERGNAGCSFYPLLMTQSPEVTGACFAAFVVNPGTRPATLALERGGVALPLDRAARLPGGGGLDLTYLPLANNAVVPPGEVALLFLSQSDSQPFARCPTVVLPAVTGVTNLRLGFEGQPTTGIGTAFHLTSDRPVIAYQVFPYGGGSSALTSATLLLPREAWGQTYLAVHPTEGAPAMAPRTIALVAAEDGTEVSIRPTADIDAAAGVPAIRRGELGKVTLRAGQYLELARLTGELTGSVVSANKPVGMFGGAACLQVPAAVCCCDSAHQQIPPVEALGSEYAAVRYRDRVAGHEESVPWRLVGAVDGTALSYLPAPPPGAPATLGRGQFVEVNAAAPFVVRSQDADHPFYLAGYMTGGDAFEGIGDPEFVNVLPTSQYLSSYVFFTDPTYPETSFVVVRKRGGDGAFADVTLECSGKPLGGWQPLGPYEYTRVDLVTGRWQPAIAGCDNGRQRMTSTAPFAVTVWGWGSKATGAGDPGRGPPLSPLPVWYTRYASYAYPAGASIGRVNNVIIIP
jgi:hypothetical protein